MLDDRQECHLVRANWVKSYVYGISYIENFQSCLDSLFRSLLHNGDKRLFPEICLK